MSVLETYVSIRFLDVCIRKMSVLEKYLYEKEMSVSERCLHWIGFCIKKIQLLLKSLNTIVKSWNFML